MSTRALLDALPLVLALELDCANRVLWMNRAALAANSCTVSDVRGLVTTDIWPETEDIEWTRTEVRRTGVSAQLVNPAVLLDGREVWLSTTIARAPEGGIVACCVDISDSICLSRVRVITDPQSRLGRVPSRRIVPRTAQHDVA